MSSTEIMVIVGAALLLFGGKRLPEILRTWAKFVRTYKRSIAQFKRQAGLDVLDDITDFQRPLNKPGEKPKNKK